MPEDARRTGDGAGEVSLQRLAELERAAGAAGPEREQALHELTDLLARPSLPKPVLKELRRVLYRLRSRGIDLSVTPGPAAPAPVAPPEEAATPSARPMLAGGSAIDAAGTARLVMVWEVRHDAWLVYALVSDRRGLEAFEAERMPRREAVEAVQRMVASELQPYEPEWGARMLAGALHVARERRTGLPRAFVVVQDRLEPALAPSQAGPYGWAREHWSAELRAAMRDPGRVEVWARASATLLDSGEVGWDMSDVLGPLLQEARRQFTTRLVLLAPTRRSVLERMAYRMSEVLHAPPVRGRLAARLAYAALRLERAGRVQPARLAAAAATVLGDEAAAVRVGVLEALAAGHLAPYLPEREAASAQSGPPSARRSPSGLLLPPGGP